MKNVLMKDNCLIQIIYAIFAMKNTRIKNIIKMEIAFLNVKKDMNQLLKMVNIIAFFVKMKANILLIIVNVKKNVKKMLWLMIKIYAIFALKQN